MQLELENRNATFVDFHTANSVLHARRQEVGGTALPLKYRGGDSPPNLSTVGTAFVPQFEYCGDGILPSI